MAIVNEGSLTFETHNVATTTVDEEMVLVAGVTVLYFALVCDANIDIATIPPWNTDEEFTLIHETTPTGSADDMHTYTYGLVNPITTADISFVIDSTVEMGFVVTQYSGTEDASVAAAFNHLNEDLNGDGSSTTAVHVSAGTSGATLLLLVGFMVLMEPLLTMLVLLKYLREMILVVPDLLIISLKRMVAHRIEGSGI